MLKKFIVVIIGAAVALAVLPAVSASADTIIPSSKKAACYGINKGTKTSHNYVVATVSGKNSSKGYVAGLGTLSKATSAQCRDTGNGYLVTTLSIFATQLKNSHGSVLARGPQIGTRSKSIVGSATTHRKIACRARLSVFMKISYSYSDRSYTRPFWVHTPIFVHC